MKLIVAFALLVPACFAQGQDWNTVSERSVTLYRESRYGEALEAADEAMHLAQRTYGTHSDQYITSLSNKAYAQAAMGDHLQALDNFRQAAYINWQVHALPHVSHLETLGELARAYLTLAEYDSTEYYLGLARFMYTSIPEKNKAHSDTAAFALTQAYIQLNAIDASLHHRKGQVDQAIRLLEEQVGWLKDLYTDYEAVTDYQTTIGNMASYCNEAGEMEKARQYAHEYYRMTRKNNRPVDVVHALQSIGGICRNTAQYDSAIYYWNRAMAAVRAGRLENSHIHTVLLNNIGELHLHLEAYDSAIYFIEQSLAIQRSREALNPPLYQTTLFNLAESYRWAGRYAPADSVYTELIDGLLDDIVHNFTYLSDNEKLAFYKNQLSIIDHYTSFALEISGTVPLQGSDKPYINPQIAGRLYNLPLTTKAVILNASRRMKNNILNSGDTSLINVYTRWEARKNELAQALLDGRHTAEELKWLKIKIEENEKWLTTNSRSFRSGFQVEKVTWQQVQQALKPDEAAVEIIRLLDGLLYGALIVTPQTTRQPVLSLIMSTRSKHLDRQFYRQYFNAVMYRLEDTLSYQTYWQPVIDSITSHMPGARTPRRVYVSNDGIYNQLNLNTLYNHQKKQYVLDETEVVVVTNTKELLTPAKRTGRAKAGKAALFGRPQFSNSDENGGPFNDLPGTGKEVAMIGSVLTGARWQATLFTGAEATEHALKTLEARTVLHVASHGFFNPSTGAGEASLAETMIRSGIVLAGAGDSTQLDEDGLLTAFEMTNLNLDSTDLVVLSACETGRGVANYGEGVYGLQRALRVAGAENIIMSLWKVDDTATQKLMVDFYRRWTKTHDMRTAFRSAQQALRKEYPDPYHWGAFILAGR